MAHLRPGGICTGRDQFESNRRTAMRALASDGFLILDFVLVIFEPHELKTFRAAADLRCHAFPRTLPNLFNWATWSQL